jgi:hypothetical protein
VVPCHRDGIQLGRAGQALAFDLRHAIVQGDDLLHQREYIFVLLLMEPVDFVGQLFKLAIKPVGDAIQPVGQPITLEERDQQGQDYEKTRDADA